MKFAVMGAGAVGCYYGGMLARAGHTVTLIGRAAHVQAMRSHGLRLQTLGFDETVAVQADTEAAAARGAQCVLLCVKSGDTEAAAAALAPHLGGDAVVLSLQNGVDNAERAQALLGVPVLPAVVYAAVEMAGPGHVRHHGRGELVLAASKHSATLHAALSAAGIPVQFSDNVTGTLWNKLIVNCAWNALSAITRLPYGPLAASPGVTAVQRDIVDECLAVARAAGVQLPADAWGAVQSIAQTMPAQLSSTAQDLARGRPSEIDHLNGHVLRLGERLGMATPANRLLHTLVRALESAASASARRP